MRNFILPLTGLSLFSTGCAQKQEQNISKFKQDKSPRQPVKSEPAPAKQPEEHKSINDIRKRLDLLKSRWNNK